MSNPQVSHLDLDGLCDVLAGEADDEQTTHVGTCASCRAQLADLNSSQAVVSAALASLVDPPVPASLEARLDAALAAERAPKVATATVTPLATARSRRTAWLPWAGGVAAASALVVGLVSLRSGGSPSDASKSQDSAARAESQQLPTSTTGNSYSAKGDLLAQALPALLTGSAAKAAAPQIGAGTRGSTTGASAPGPQAAPLADPLAALHDRTTLAACLAGLSDPTGTSLPLALDYAAFDGQPALVVVYPTTKPGKVDVFVVGAGCTQADSKLLFFTRLSKP